MAEIDAHPRRVLELRADEEPDRDECGVRACVSPSDVAARRHPADEFTKTPTSARFFFLLFSSSFDNRISVFEQRAVSFT